MGRQGSTPGFFEKRELLFAAKPDAAALKAPGAAFWRPACSTPRWSCSDGRGQPRASRRSRRPPAARATPSALWRRARLSERRATPDEWVAIGETALSAGMLSFAYRAFEKADHQDGLERTRAAMHAAGITPEQQ